MDQQVVELEISLDETREQYNNVLKSSNNRAQQKKMMFLERNLEQLTVVQRQLVEQNSSLKKEVAIAERKLIARNERIQSLEQLLQDSQEKLTAANHRYVDKISSMFSLLLKSNMSEKCKDGTISLLSPYLPVPPTKKISDLLSPIKFTKEGHGAPKDEGSISYFTSSDPIELDGWTNIDNPPRFEAQLTAVKERLEAAKQGSTRGLGSPSAGASFAFGGAVGSRVAKPIRGGGSSVQDGPVHPSINSLQGQDGGAQPSGKRTSWFFNKGS